MSSETPIYSEWIPEARQIAAQCWCEETTQHLEMQSGLAEAFARKLALWMDTAAVAQRNCDFYRGMLEECAKHFDSVPHWRRELHTSKDGSVQDDPLLLNIPDLVAAVIASETHEKN